MLEILNNAGIAHERGQRVRVERLHRNRIVEYANRPCARSSPALANGVVYIGGNQNLYALDAATGKVLWTYATGNTIQSSPAVVDGVVYVGSNDENVYAFGLSDNHETDHGSVSERPALRPFAPTLASRYPIRSLPSRLVENHVRLV